MRIGELSAATSVTVPTIKYYIREGLLPAGHKTSFNQSDYTEEHVCRLLVIKLLVGVGRLSLNEVRTVLDAGVDEASLADVLSSHRVASTREAVEGMTDEELEWAQGLVDKLLTPEEQAQRSPEAVQAFMAAIANVPEQHRHWVEQFNPMFADIAKQIAEADRVVCETMLEGNASESLKYNLAIAGSVVRSDVLDALVALYQDARLSDLAAGQSERSQEHRDE